MTFTELLTVFQRDIIADRGTDVFSDDDGKKLLKEASVEIAAMLGFPQAVSTEDLSDGDTAITAPNDIASAQLGQVMIGPWDLRPVGYAEVLRQRQLGADIPTVYNFDPRRGDNIEFGPALAGSATATVEYTQSLNAGNMNDGDQAWDGRLKEWHWLIPLRAGVTAFQMVQDFERAQYYLQRTQLGLNSLGAYLGVPSPQVLREQRDETPRRDNAEVS